MAWLSTKMFYQQFFLNNIQTSAMNVKAGHFCNYWRSILKNMYIYYFIYIFNCIYIILYCFYLIIIKYIFIKYLSYILLRVLFLCMSEVGSFGWTGSCLQTLFGKSKENIKSKSKKNDIIWFSIPYCVELYQTFLFQIVLAHLVHT